MPWLCHAHAVLRPFRSESDLTAWQGNGMGAAWARHALCKLAFNPSTHHPLWRLEKDLFPLGRRPIGPQGRLDGMIRRKVSACAGNELRFSSCLNCVLSLPKNFTRQTHSLDVEWINVCHYLVTCVLSNLRILCVEDKSSCLWEEVKEPFL